MFKDQLKCRLADSSSWHKAISSSALQVFVSDEDRELDITDKSKKTKNNVMWLYIPQRCPGRSDILTLLQRLATVVFI